VIVKKTNTLNKNEIQQYCTLFSDVFNKQMSIEEFFKKYQNNAFGYSYHSFILDNDIIVGSYTVIPYKYNFFGSDMVFGLSVDTMIKDKYRGSPFTFKKLANNVYNELKKDKIPFVFGFPNDNVYLVRKKILKWADIGNLSYYVMPIKIENISNSYKKFSILNKAYQHVVNKFSSSKMDNIDVDFRIKKNIDSGFFNCRYDKSYVVKKYKSCYFAYRVYNENDILTAFIIDIYPLTKQNTEFCAKYIYQNEKNIDIVIYVGNLTFKALNLIKVPKKFEPKTIHMSGKILIPELVDERVFNLSNWNVNLSNYDVR